ncbi:solute carrier family 23 protein [Bacillus tuaregi]|uniref:solute carrier family 23 protein n=1 Tax=Bacillus tuaregi TaxID=1816695 RepID=UPI0008F83838|nr:solute carrier family 23 protein [Bacillus tuaregi]
MSIFKRKDGEIQPYWPIGKYQLRLPFIHYRLETPELIQGVVIFTIGLSMIEIMRTVLGMSYEAALAIVILHLILMVLPSTLGVPFVSGFITPVLPVLIVFLGKFEPGPEAVRALIAVQFVTALIFFLLGVTGLGQKVIKILPNSLKAGILIGAGIGAIMGEIQEGGRLAATPITLTIGGMLCLYIMFSLHFKKLYAHNRFFKKIANFGIVPAILIAMVVGWIVGEYSMPQVQWGITIPNIAELWNVTPFVVGFPSLSLLISAIPTGILAYIIAYGDIIVGENIVRRANEARKDEKIQYDMNQVHMVTAVRGFLHSFFAPHPGLAGPLFSAGTASVAERYTFGRKAMDSIFSGSNSLVISMICALFVLPLVTFFQPILPVAYSITLILTGYLCVTLGVKQVNTEEEIGVAVVMAVVLALYGAAYGLMIGMVLYFLIQRKNLLSLKKDGMEKAVTEKQEEKAEQIS